jgi:quinol monooxygenase YgiN
MTTLVLTRCRVDDFDAWRPKFNTFASGQRAILWYRVWQGVDDPNLVVIMEGWESREAFDALVANPGLEEAMAADGVDLSSVTIDVVAEIP